jgi:hypothetical protein
MLVAEGFVLSVPAGAFASSETLLVTVLGASEEFGTDAVSSLYRVDGLPLVYSLPLRIELQCTRAPDPGLFLQVGEVAGSPFGPDLERFYDALPALFSNGLLSADLPPPSAESPLSPPVTIRTAAEEPANEKWFVGVDYTDSLLSEGQHFRFLCRRYMNTPAATLARHFERAYDSCRAAGFDREGLYQAFPWPMEIDIRNFPGGQQQTLAALREVSLTSDAQQILASFSFNECPLAGYPPYTLGDYVASCFLKALSGATVLKVEERHPTLTEEQAHQYRWLLESIIEWAPTLVLPEDSWDWFVPGSFPARWRIPLGGLALSAGEDFGDHGRGWTPLLLHLAQDYGGPPTVAAAFNALLNTPDGVAALLSSVPVPESVWLPEFYRKYIGGELYNVGADAFLETIGEGETFVFDGPEDSLGQFDYSYPDLSAKLFRVNLRADTLSEDVSITFTPGPGQLDTGYVRVIVFTYKDGQLTYRAMSEQVTIAGVRELNNSGYDLVVAVVNSSSKQPYEGTLLIELLVRVLYGQNARAKIPLRVFTSY